MTRCNPTQDPIREEALDWVLRVESAPNDAELRAAALAWRQRSPAHESAWQRVAKTWRLAGDLPTDYADTVRETTPPHRSSYQQEAPQGDSARASAVPRRRVAMATVMAVAACLLIVTAPALQLRFVADYVTGVGEARSITLNDGSTVHLDAESAVAIDYTPSQRTVRLLAGQAFFDVRATTGRPFTVPADGLSVTVTGTGFVVGIGAETTSVTVQSGSVDVAVDGFRDKRTNLTLGDRLSLARETGVVTRSRVLPKDIATWRSGRLVVDGMPLRDLVETLDRYHHGVIWLRGADLAERRVTGVFNLRNPIGALTAAADTQNAAVTQISPFFLVVTAR